MNTGKYIKYFAMMAVVAVLSATGCYWPAEVGECSEDSDCGFRNICEGMVCVAGCRDDSTCGLGNICEGLACVAGCREDSACGTGKICNYGSRCVVGCREDSDCSGGSMWCNNKACEDDCLGRNCGDSPHLGVSCGSCDSGKICVEGSCTVGCDENSDCGGGSMWCNNKVCEDDCAGMNCGDSPHLGVSCGSCVAGKMCAAGSCTDGCNQDIDCGGGSMWCNNNACEDDCSKRDCGDSPHLGIDCGSCSGLDECLEGQCIWQADDYTPSCSNGMCLVPAGSFWMGCNSTINGETQYGCALDESPFHEVVLSGYHIDKTEVTREAYKKCVTAGQCTAPPDYCCKLDDGSSANRPMSCVTWVQAGEYCAWVGKRLPTEAEWEKAARGTDGRWYPWGNDYKICKYAIENDGWGKNGCGTDATWNVCSKSPAGDSPYGLCDMAGNVWEWVSDWYSDSYYSSSPPSNPPGPTSGSYRVLRGDSFYYEESTYYHAVRASDRFFQAPSDFAFHVGFRCARSQ